MGILVYLHFISDCKQESSDDDSSEVRNDNAALTLYTNTYDFDCGAKRESNLTSYTASSSVIVFVDNLYKYVSMTCISTC